MSDSITSSRQYCTFQLARFHCGIGVLAVHEILRHQPMTPVPLAPPVVRGLINLRGQIITALDMRIRLGFPPRGAGAPPVVIVVGCGAGAGAATAALLVDEIGEVAEVDQADCELPPDTVPDALRAIILAVSKREHGLLLLLDVAKMMVIP